MSVFSFLIFDRNYCLYQHDWSEAYHAKGAKEQQRQQRLLHGLMFSLKRFSEKISSPLESGGFAPPFETMSTPEYKLHLFESMSGYKFVLLTDPSLPSQKAKLKHIYENMFVPLVILAPDFEPSSLTADSATQRITALIHTTTFPTAVREYLDKCQDG